MAWRYPPPGGFAGFAQETPAQQAQFGRPASNGGGGRRRKKAKKAAAPKRRKRRTAAKAGKGSAAMKRKMARLRKMRRK